MIIDVNIINVIIDDANIVDVIIIVNDDDVIMIIMIIIIIMIVIVNTATSVLIGHGNLRKLRPEKKREH